MKTYAKYVVLFVLILSLAACQSKISKTESLTNALEAYLYAMGSGDTSATEPDISSLSNAEKSKIVNQLSFSFVFEREDYLFSYLDNQWQDWQADEGFVVSYLKNRYDLEEKRLTVLQEEKVEIQSALIAPSLADFYKSVAKYLEKNDFDSKNFYFLNDSPIYQFVYVDGKFKLDRASILLLDIRNDESYTCIYNADKLFISSSKKIDLNRQNMPLLDVKAFDASSFAPLLAPETTAARLIYKKTRSFDRDAIPAYFNGKSFQLETLENGDHFLAYLEIISDDVRQNYILYTR